jgi:ubiquinone/menaquinone biosynthesis C-methylase UbiE
LIASTQETVLGPFVTPQTFELASPAQGRLASAEREFADGPRLFESFAPELTPGRLVGRDVLDLGCGYGGRTVFYAETGAHTVAGIEIADGMIRRCRLFAEQRSVKNVEFQVGFAESLPFADHSFDQLVSFDVLEHVQDPVLAFREIRRVLRPAGEAWLIFPTFLGARSSHLDYLTQVPAIHRIFEPTVLIEVVNEFLVAAPERYGTNPQPRPAVGPLGARALPSVNGMTRREAFALVERSGLRIRGAETTPLLGPHAPSALRPLSAALRRIRWRGWPPDLLVGSIRMHLVAD